MSIGKLIPVQVPWMVSPSVSGIRISLEEEGDAIITFNIGEFRFLTLNTESDEPTDPRVQVVFKAGQWLRTYPFIKEGSTPPSDTFDLSALPFYDPSGSIDEYWATFEQRWVESGYCPNPKMYEVEGSSWITESDAARFNVKHLVIAGNGF